MTPPLRTQQWKKYHHTSQQKKYNNNKTIKKPFSFDLNVINLVFLQHFIRYYKQYKCTSYQVQQLGYQYQFSRRRIKISTSFTEIKMGDSVVVVYHLQALSY